MSIQAVTWVITHSAATLGARLVLISIANHADGSGGYAFPSIRTIAAEAHLSERQAQRAIRRLEKIGELGVTPGDGRHGTHLYSLLRMGDKLSGGRGDKLSEGGVTIRQGGGDISGKKQAQNVTRTVPKPSLKEESDSPDGESSVVEGSADRPSVNGTNGNHHPDMANGESVILAPEKPKPKTRASPKTEQVEIEAEFEVAYAAYPKHTARRDALKAYCTARKRASAETILSAVRRYAEARRGEPPQYTKQFSGWLNGQRWLDEEIQDVQRPGDYVDHTRATDMPPNRGNRTSFFDILSRLPPIEGASGS